MRFAGFCYGKWYKARRCNYEKNAVVLVALIWSVLLYNALGALYFNGNAVVDMGANKFPGLTNLTLEVWICSSNAPALNDYASIAGQGYLATGDGFGIHFNGDKTLNFQVRNSKPASVSNAAKTTYGFDGMWHHVAGVRQGDETLLYLDGIMVNVSTQALPDAFNTTAKFALGSRDANGWKYYFKGYMAEVRLWDHARPPELIRSFRDKKLFGDEAGLLGYWPLDEGEGATVFDHSGNKVNGSTLRTSWDSEKEFVPNVPLVNTLTGSTAFTGSNRVQAASLAIPDGYTEFQYTIYDQQPLPGAWVSVGVMPAEFAFPRPVGDTNVVINFWFTNQVTSIPLCRIAGQIFYTTNKPQPSVQSLLLRSAVHAVTPTVVTWQECEAGSSGGSANSREMSIFRQTVSSLADTTTELDFVTLMATGSFEVVTTVVNEAGNSTAAATVVTITEGELRTWSGAGKDKLASTPGNWVPAIAPVTGNSILMVDTAQKECTWDLDIVVSEWTHAPSFVGQVVFETHYPGAGTFTNFTIARNAMLYSGVWTHPVNSGGAEEVNRLCVTVGGNMFLDGEAAINLDGTGFAAGSGPGAGNALAATSSRSASHGGSGARNIEGKGTYGSIVCPESLGSGAQGRGGGALRLAVGGAMELDGKIVARGVVGNNNGNYSPGAGGSILLLADSLGGCGEILAGADDAAIIYYGSGGGRIALHLTSESDLSGLEISAAPHGKVLNGGGRAGTIYLKTPSLKRVLIDQRNIGTATGNHTDLPPRLASFVGDPVFDNEFADAELVVTNGAFLGLTRDCRAGNILYLNGNLALNSWTLYLKSPEPAGSFPADYGGGSIIEDGLFYTFDGGSELIRDGRVLWGDAPVSWRVVSVTHESGGGETEINGTMREGYFAHQSRPLFSATASNDFSFASWDGTLDAGSISPDNPLQLAQITGNKALRAWFRPADSDMATNRWLTGKATDLWFDARNWSQVAVPAAGQTVVIPSGATVVLAGETPQLAGVVVDGGSLVFSNWNSCLNSDIIFLASNTVVTTPAVEPNTDASNRIHMVCRELTLEATAKIDVENRGFAGGLAAKGKGLGGDTVGCAGYGGRGGDSFASGRFGGVTYGDATAPLLPGSGGYGGHPNYGNRASNGGGAVRLEVAGHACINGTVNANGGPYHSTSGYTGSGGAIWISCGTFASTNGHFTAEGRDHVGGGSGGGRIAITYDTVAQSLLPPVQAVFSARGGANLTVGVGCVDGEPGTLYFSDRQLLGDMPWYHSGQLNFADVTDTITFTDLIMSNGHIRLPAGITTVAVDGDLIVDGIKGRFEIGGGGHYAVLRGPWRHQTPAPAPTMVIVAGDAIVCGGATLWLIPPQTNGIDNVEGLVMEVGGRFEVAAGSVYKPLSDPVNGASVAVKCRDMLLAAGAKVDVHGTGFIGGRGSVGLGPGASTHRGGGGHGGYGGYYVSTQPRGLPYGDEFYPLYAGSGGGAHSSHVGGHGGGRIRFAVAGSAFVDCLLDAAGLSPFGDQASGGSGGSILIECRRFMGGAECELLVTGGRTIGNFGGGGGGGRIALIYGDSFEFAGSYDVSGGTGYAENGAVGTMAIVDRGPVVTNLPATDTGYSMARVHGEVLSVGQAVTEVAVYWGTSDGGTDAKAWQNFEPYAETTAGLVSNLLINLQGETQYYYRYHATNAYGAKWSPVSSAFSTLGGPGVENNAGATNITVCSALLQGVVVSGNPLPQTCIAWGDTDGGDAGLTAWQNVIPLGEVLGPFSASVEGLLANKTYHYRCYASNEYGSAWAPQTASFKTLSPNLTIGDTEIMEGDFGTSVMVGFPVNISAVSAVAVSVDFTTVNGTAAAGQDYVATNGTLTIAAGSTSATIWVKVVGDNDDEYPFEEFTVALTTPNGVVIERDEARCRIWDDDDQPQTKQWSGTGLWSEPGKWDPLGVPGPADKAIILSGNVTIDVTCLVDHPIYGGVDALQMDSLLVVDGAVVEIGGWETKLAVSGNVTVSGGGKITTATVAVLEESSNRVYVTCADLVVKAGGKIDVDSRGHGGGLSSWGVGPGAGNGAAGHGGFAGDVFGSYTGGGMYGEIAAPVAAGSGGRSSHGAHLGANGGGAVRIVASGNVDVSGAILASGGAGTSTGQGAAGSGGSIWITCATFSGTGGVIRADGRNNASGGSGGGRIAVVYDPEAQSSLEEPTVTFSSRGGKTGTAAAITLIDGEPGTLYFTDQQLLGALPWQHSGQLYFAGFSGDLLLEAVTLSGGHLRIPPTVTNLVIAGDLAVDGADSVFDIGGGGRYAASRGPWRPINTAPAPVTVAVDGDLTLRNGGKLTLIPAVTNGVDSAEGMVVDVKGEFIIGDDCWLYPLTNPTNGASVFIKCGRLAIDKDGGINAVGRGFIGGRGSTGMGPGASTHRGGGGHGGYGGAYAANQPRGLPCGDALYPLFAGSGGGGAHTSHTGGHGGGLIRFGVAGSARVDGLLDTAGLKPFADQASGGSGGSILIECHDFSGGSTALLRAPGGSTIGNFGGGGGGGRISIIYGDRYEPGISARRLVVAETPPETFDGEVHIFGGGGYYEDGDIGTVRFVRVLYPAATLIMLR